MNENYLPLAYLNAWEYCPRRFYIEYELGEMADNEYILQGRHIHRNVDVEGTHQEEDTTTHRHQWVWSDRLKVNGVIDAVEEKQGKLIPLEYKKGRQGRHLNDHFQLCAAALCIEERTNKTISYGEIFYYGNRRRQKEAKKALDKYIQELEGEKLVSAKGEVYYVFPRGEKIFKEETQLQLESSADRKINRLEEQITKIQKQIEPGK